MKLTILFLLILLFSSHAFAVAPAVDVQTYDALLHAIREVRVASQERIDRAINQEKVREAWETGKLIDTHVLQHKERADYGEKVLKRLAIDLGTNDTELYYCLRFARAYPISRPAEKLSWSHYQSILTLNDPKERKEVEEEAVRENWNRDQVREEVGRRQSRAERGISNQLSISKPGKIHTYRVVKAASGPHQGQLVLDLGFSNYFQPNGISKFKEGDIVTFVPARDVLISAGRPQTTGAEGTYNAYVTEIIDGDTFYALIDLGFEFSTLQKLRLRGLDAPEIESADGREAKAFLVKQLPQNGTPVLIKTAKSDKYDRYLVDVWVGETWINQLLLNQELAVMVEN